MFSVDYRTSPGSFDQHYEQIMSEFYSINNLAITPISTRYLLHCELAVNLWGP